MTDLPGLPEHELRRTARQMNLPGFGPEQQAALHRAHVLIIGAGGLGCPIAQTLAATGVGYISLIDDDTVDLTNIHRQILFGASDVGRKKVEVAAERLRELQPGITVTPIDGRMTTENAVDLLRGSKRRVDVLIDGSDTFATKFLAADAAEITGTPLVWGTVLRYRGDVALWWSGPGSPQADAPREAGEGSANGVGLRDLYPDQPDADSVPDCATAGVLGVTTSVVGGLMATEVVKFLTGIGSSTPGELRMYDALTATIKSFTVTRDPGRALTTELAADYGGACAVPSDEGSVARRLVETVQRGEAVAIDVREVYEKAVSDLPVDETYHLPTSDVELYPQLAAELLGELPEGTEAVVYCASGVRSQWFADTFQPLADQRGITLLNLPGGVNGLN